MWSWRKGMAGLLHNLITYDHLTPKVPRHHFAKPPKMSVLDPLSQRGFGLGNRTQFQSGGWGCVGIGMRRCLHKPGRVVSLLKIMKGREETREKAKRRGENVDDKMLWIGIRAMRVRNGDPSMVQTMPDWYVENCNMTIHPPSMFQHHRDCLRRMPLWGSDRSIDSLHPYCPISWSFTSPPIRKELLFVCSCLLYLSWPPTFWSHCNTQSPQQLKQKWQKMTCHMKWRLEWGGSFYWQPRGLLLKGQDEWVGLVTQTWRPAHMGWKKYK